MPHRIIFTEVGATDIAVFRVHSGYRVRYGLDTFPPRVSLARALEDHESCLRHALSVLGLSDA